MPASLRLLPASTATVRRSRFSRPRQRRESRFFVIQRRKWISHALFDLLHFWSLEVALERRREQTGVSTAQIVQNALAQYFETPLHTLFHVSTSGSLVAGVYDGAVKGLMIGSADEIAPVMKRAFDTPGPVIAGVQVDYSENARFRESRPAGHPLSDVQ